jgi:Cyclic phosphodiesterase-like protein
MGHFTQGAALSKPPLLVRVMGMSEQIVAYWLCPAEPARRYLAALIGELAARFDAVAFEPHVTIYATSAEGEQPGRTLAEVVPGHQQYRLAVLGLECSDKFTKTLFVQFAPHPELARCSEDLRRASVSKNDYDLNPHLSLLYKMMNPEAKRELTDSIALPFSEIIFDTVKAVICPAKIESPGDVEMWRVVAEEKLER